MTKKKPIMNEVFKTDGQNYGEIRRLCLICHGLDGTNDTLFKASSYVCKSEETKKAFHKLMSGALKKLATAIQMHICHDNLEKKDYPVLKGGSLYYLNYKHVRKDFNIREISDKIINADSVSNDLISAIDFGNSKMKTMFTGEHHGKAWALYLSVECFVEAILGFLDMLEAKGSCRMTPRVKLFARDDDEFFNKQYHCAPPLE
jgi:hypothetical protein